MNGGLGYYTAYLPFVVYPPVRHEKARAPPDSRQRDLRQPQTRRRASGGAASPGEPRSNPVSRTRSRGMTNLTFSHATCNRQLPTSGSEVGGGGAETWPSAEADP
jgi:hypothetical protein